MRRCEEQQHGPSGRPVVVCGLGWNTTASTRRCSASVFERTDLDIKETNPETQNGST
jgi:hypothetical protein